MMVICSLTLVSAAPPNPTQVILNLDSGLNIEVPRITTLKQNEDFQFTFHVYNITSGLRVDNSSINCTFELYNSSGIHIIESDLEFGDNDWEMLVKGGNFSDIGSYYYIVDCQSDSEGGVFVITLQVTATGQLIDTPESKFYIVIIFAILILFGMFLTIFIITPFSNKKELTKDGWAIVKITGSKYLKLISVWIAYGFFLWFITIISGIANNYIFFEGLKKMITSLLVYLSILGWGINLAMLGILFILAWKDIVWNKAVKRHGHALIKKL